jgi:hypothetical protein
VEFASQFCLHQWGSSDSLVAVHSDYMLPVKHANAHPGRVTDLRDMPPSSVGANILTSATTIALSHVSLIGKNSQT